ncbi:MAG: dipeptidase [Acidobacteriota bacterium]
MQDSRDVLDRVERERETYLDELKDYLRIPSISTDPAYDAEVRRCADWLLERMRDAGLDARLIEGEGKPLVYGEHLGAGPDKPTILFYGHYDVQPPDPLDEWRHPPFEPTIEGERLIARGATDDKGQSYVHLKAVAAVLAERGALPCNVKFLIEGEEESGGEHIECFVRADGGEHLACDAVFISDSAMFGKGQPSLIYGLKGMAYLELRVDGPSHDLHSGGYGGQVRNPANALCSIIASLHDPTTGRVAIEGFYDRVLDLSDAERAEAARLPFDEDGMRADIDVTELVGEDGYSTIERRWARPTCDVNGMWSGYLGEGAKTIIPAYAAAKISMRLVPDQDPVEIEDAFVRHVEAHAPAGVRTSVTRHHGGRAVLVDLEGPIVEAAEQAMADEWARPYRVREGGSIPIVSTFAEVLEKPVILLGLGLEDDRLHSPNEKFDIPQFYGGIRALVRFLDRLADVEAT